jgi:hypothetical protein
VNKTNNMLEDLSAKDDKINTSNVKVIPITEDDYVSPEALSSHLKGQDALIDLLNRDKSIQSIALIDAAFSANLKHVIPSSFGLGHSHPYIHSIPPTAKKMQMETHLFDLANNATTKHGLGNATTYTSIQTSVFFDYALKIGMIINTSDRMGGATMVVDGGTPITTHNSYADIATAVKNAVILGVRRDPRVLNKEMFIRSFERSHNTLLGYVNELAPNREFKTLPINSTELEKESRRKQEIGDVSPDATRGFLLYAGYALGLGRFKEEDAMTGNEVLGVQEWDDEKIKEAIKGIL